MSLEIQNNIDKQKRQQDNMNRLSNLPKDYIIIKIKSFEKINKHYLSTMDYELDELPAYYFSKEDKEKSTNMFDCKFCVLVEDIGSIMAYPKNNYEKAKWYIEEICTKEKYPEYFV